MLIVLLVFSLLTLLVATTLAPLPWQAPVFWAHGVLAMAALPLIMAAMQHFVPVLTRSRAAEARLSRLPLALVLVGGVLLLVFSGALAWGWIVPLAALVFLAAVWMLVWMRQRSRNALGGAHPGLAWYVAALACLLLGMTAAALIPLFPPWQGSLRQFHLHINLYGFIGLTAVGTLQVLFPTATGRVDAGVSQRLRHDLAWAFTGAVLLALGRTLEVIWITVPGVLFWLWPLARMAGVWLRTNARQIFAWHGAAPVLAAATLGLTLALVGVLLPGIASLDIFLAGFMFPLVSGAASQLIPVWVRPGRQSDWHEKARAAIGRYNGVRALFYMTSALLPLLGYRCGAMAGLLALLWFVAGLAYWGLNDWLQGSGNPDGTE